jgi:type IV secretion system protein VirD4
LSTLGGALVSLTRVDDLLLSFGERKKPGHPVAVLDPFGVALGLPDLGWDLLARCGRA